MMNIIIIMPSFGQVSGVSVNIFDLDFLDLLDIADNDGTTCSLIVILSCSILNSLSSLTGPLLACLLFWTPDFSRIGSYKITHVSPLVS